MSTKFHFNPKTGKVGACEAENNCPFGNVSPHYNTEQDAQVGYEKYAEENAVGVSKTLSKKSSSNSKMSKSELAKAVKETDDSSIIDAAVESDSVRARNNALKNPNITSEQLARLVEKHPEHQKDVDRHPKTDLSTLSDEYITKKYTFRSDDRLNSINEEQLDRFKKLRGNYSDMDNAVSNPDTDISENKREEVMIENGSYHTVNRAIRNGVQFDQAKVAKTLDKSSQTWIAREVTQPEAVKELAKNQELHGHLLSNKNLDAESIRNINSKIDSQDFTSQIIMYENRNTPDDVRNELRNSSNERVKSYVTLSDFEQKYPDKYKQTFASSANRTSGQKREYQLDPEKIKKAGFDSTDVDTYFRFKQNDYLFSSSYNEETGVYTGYID